MIFSVTYVKKMIAFTIHMAKSLGVVKLCLSKSTVHEPYFCVANLLLELHIFFVDDQDSIVCRVRNYKKIVRHIFLSFNAKYFTRVFKVLIVGIFQSRRFRNLSLIYGRGRLFHFFRHILEGDSVIQVFVVIVIRH